MEESPALTPEGCDPCGQDLCFWWQGSPVAWVRTLVGAEVRATPTPYTLQSSKVGVTNVATDLNTYIFTESEMRTD